MGPDGLQRRQLVLPRRLRHRPPQRHRSLDRRPHQRRSVLQRRAYRMLVLRPAQLLLRPPRHHLRRRHLLPVPRHWIGLGADVAAAPDHASPHGHRHGLQGLHGACVRC